MKKRVSILLCAMLLVPLFGKDVVLMENGKSKCVIVPSAAPTLPEQHAASELALFLAKISNGEKPLIVKNAPKGKNIITFQLLKKDPTLKRDGFRIVTKGNKITISSLEARGLLFGAYEILKRYTGIRWLFPGKDGEYFKKQPTIKVPEGKYEHNPSFNTRAISTICMGWDSPIWDTWDWAVRNNMAFWTSPGVVRQKDKHEGLLKRGVLARIGGHCFSDLLIGPLTNKLNNSNRMKYVDKLFAEHPEYFPLRRGKRVKIWHGGVQPQPCTSHPEVIRRSAKELVAQYRRAKSLGVPIFYSFGNNDTTQWCECKNCVAQDPAEERKRGWISTRYWKFLNAVLALAKKEEPGLLVEGWSYQNYSEPPLGVKPDLDLRSLDISNHRRCWKHLLNDKNCPTNQWYHRYSKVWNDTKLPTVPYAELTSAGRAFLPTEKNWVDNLKLYKKILPYFDGERTEVCCPDGKYSGRFNTYECKNNWRMMWQTMYMGMVFHWDVDQDFDKVWEEANSLFYGKGWAGGMREFRKLLFKLYMDASGCWGYGHSTPVGKFLDVPGAKEKLYSYLDSAEKAAAKDPDKRALAHVKKDREYFERTWVKAYNAYIKNYREVKAYPLMGKITLDGKLDERDWKNADVQTRFVQMKKNELAKHQTSVKICYDAENIYMGIECMEPEMDKILTYVKKHDGPVWSDNDVEIFLNDPMLGSNYFQIIINANGVVCDLVSTGVGRNDKSYESGVKVAAFKGKDRWVLELAIPARKIIGSTLKAGQVIRMNISRERNLSDDGKNFTKRGKESSSWSQGLPHSVDVFHPVSFAAPRRVAAGNRTEIDTRIWKNGSFNELASNARYPKYWKHNGKKPASWGFSSGKNYAGDIEMLLHPGSSTNYFIRMRKGFMYQGYHKINTPKMRLAFRVRGKGSLRISVLRENSKGKSLPTRTVKTMDFDTKNKWENVNFVYDRPGDPTERHHLILWVIKKDSQLDLDDVYIAGVEK